MEKKYFYATGKKPFGPVTESDLRDMAVRGDLKRTDRVWCKGMETWQPAETVADIFDELPPALEPESPPPLEPPPLMPAALAEEPPALKTEAAPRKSCASLGEAKAEAGQDANDGNLEPQKTPASQVIFIIVVIGVVIGVLSLRLCLTEQKAPGSVASPWPAEPELSSRNDSHNTPMPVREAAIASVSKAEEKAASQLRMQKPSMSIGEAVDGGNLEEIRNHLRNGIDVNTRLDSEHSTPLHLACRRESKNSRAVVQLLLSAGASVDARMTNGWTPLLVAAVARKLEVVELLIAKGADVNAKDDTGMTPLHWCGMFPPVAEEEEQIALILLAHGANPRAVAKDGTTPCDYARAFKKPKMVKILAP